MYSENIERGKVENYNTIIQKLMTILGSIIR